MPLLGDELGERLPRGTKHKVMQFNSREMLRQLHCTAAYSKDHFTFDSEILHRLRTEVYRRMDGLRFEKGVHE